jgi:hypothetical protein
MMRAAVVAGAFVILATAVVAQDDSGSPHKSLEMCAVCHNEDMSLQRSKLETCTLCHAPTVHAGAAEHLRVDPARVTRALADQSGKPDPGAALPLTDDHHIWCGTCHLFHDPSIDAWLPMGWIPPSSGMSASVRDGVTTKWGAIAAAHGESKPAAQFASKGTRALRLPVDDGSLCARCHGRLP